MLSFYYVTMKFVASDAVQHSDHNAQSVPSFS